MKKTCDRISKECFERTSKLNFAHIFYSLCLISIGDASYNTVPSELKDRKIVNVTKTGILKKRDKIGVDKFKKFFDSTTNFIRSNYHKVNIYAVDCSKLSLNLSAKEEGFRVTKRGTYCKALLTCLYDVTNKMVADIHLTNNENEREAFELHLNKIPKNSIVIFDRGYYSQEFLELLVKHQIHPIFRMRITDNFIKEFLNEKDEDKITTINGIKLRLVKYKIDTIIEKKSSDNNVDVKTVKDTKNKSKKKESENILQMMNINTNKKEQKFDSEESSTMTIEILKNGDKKVTRTFILATTLFDKDVFTLDILKNLYHDRWSVEEYFKTLKHTLHANKFNSKTVDNIRKELYIKVIISSISRYLETR